MIHPLYLPMPRRLPPRMPQRRWILEKKEPSFANFSYCSYEDVESLTEICYTLSSQSTGCRRPQNHPMAGQRLFQNTVQEMNA